MDRKAIEGAGATALVVAAVAGIGIWARRQPSEVPLRIEPLPASTPERPDPSTNTAANVAGPTPSPARSAVPSPGPATGRLVRVSVLGAVRTPGTYSLPEGAKISDAIESAGGPTETGDPSTLNLALPIREGMAIVVPESLAPSGEGGPVRDRDPGHHPTNVPMPRGKIGASSGGESEFEPASRGARSERRPRVQSSRKGDDLRPASISINRADLEQWQQLPGVGPTTAEKILAERTRRGGFDAIDDLLDVKGIGPKKLAKMRPYLTL